jgi:hypothetical protein
MYVYRHGETPSIALLPLPCLLPVPLPSALPFPPFASALPAPMSCAPIAPDLVGAPPQHLHQERNPSQVTHFCKCNAHISCDIPFLQVTFRLFCVFPQKNRIFTFVLISYLLYYACYCYLLFRSLVPFLTDLLKCIYQPDSIICLCTNSFLRIPFFLCMPHFQHKKVCELSNKLPFH